MKKFFTLRKGNTKGFTLVELMIVVAIIGILAAIAIPQFAQYRKRGYVSTINSDVKNAFTALAAMVADNSALDIDSVTETMIIDAGFTQSPGVTTVLDPKTSWDEYTLTSTGLDTWGLTKNDASMNQDGELIPAKAN